MLLFECEKIIDKAAFSGCKKSLRSSQTKSRGLVNWERSQRAAHSVLSLSRRGN
jgi:hypothetical protein